MIKEMLKDNERVTNTYPAVNCLWLIYPELNNHSEHFYLKLVNIFDVLLSK